MPIDDWYIGAYWLARPESAEECALRISRYLTGLGEIDPTFSQWFEKARSLKKAHQLRFEPTPTTIEALLKKKRYQFTWNGFSFDAWTGRETNEQGGDFSAFCGNDFTDLNSNVTLRVPYRGKAAEHLNSTEMLTRLLRLTVTCWEPECGVVMTHRLHNLTEFKDEPKKRSWPAIGWINYISRERGVVPPLPEPVQVEPVGELGTLITLTPEQFSVDNLAHVALARQVRDLLDDAGLLQF